MRFWLTCPVSIGVSNWGRGNSGWTLLKCLFSLDETPPSCLPQQMRKRWMSHHKIFETSAVEQPFVFFFLFVTLPLWFSPAFYFSLNLCMSFLKVCLVRLSSPHSLSFFFLFLQLFSLVKWLIYLIQQIRNHTFLFYHALLIFYANYESSHSNLVSERCCKLLNWISTYGVPWVQWKWTPVLVMPIY